MSTKIFVSSVSKGLEEVRLQVSKYLESLGHTAMYFENVAFAKNQSSLMLTTCLNEVSKCDIYLLIIGREVGHIVQEANKSVTHLELLKAISSKKSIYVFVEQYIKDSYFNEYLRVYSDLRNGEPHLTNNTVPTHEEIMKKLKISIDSRVFAILNDAYQVVPWIFGFNKAEDITSTMKSELSTALANHIKIHNQLNNIEDIEEASRRLKQYDLFLQDFYYLLEGALPIRNMEELLRISQRNLKGDTIYFDEGMNIWSKLIKVANCEGITLYKYDSRNKLELIATSGLAGKRRDLVELSDRESYVAISFTESLDAEMLGENTLISNIFLSESIIYLCFVFNNHVLTIHFPIEEIYVDEKVLVQKGYMLFDELLNIKSNSDIIKLIGYCLD